MTGQQANGQPAFEPLDPAGLEKAGFDTVIVSGVDMQGRLFGKRMSPRRFRALLAEGLHICTCVYSWDIEQGLGLEVEFAGAHTGWQDFRLVPDLTTLRPAAWLDATAICLADSVDEDTGEPLAVAPRTILRRQADSFEAAGHRPYAATELEFYLYHGTPAELRKRRYQDLEPTTLAHADYNIGEGNQMEPFFRQVRRALEASGIPVEVSQVEYGLGQWEINLEYGPAMAAADQHVLFKQAVKDLAAANGMTATFMPRPVGDDLGSSCHIHASLRGLDGGTPFFDPGRDRGMSAVLGSAVAGVLEHAADLMLWYAPTINSARRIGSQDFAGNGLTWGFDNRTTTCRVLTGQPSATRLEFRLPGADVNPYLAIAGMLGSMRRGIADGADPGKPSAGDAYGEIHEEFPQNLAEAAEQFLNSEFAAATFGADVVRHYHAVARHEWRQFMRSVTDWELVRYFEAI
ncbi:glutamine synthetase family protein [Thermocatellispora tengchongensis]